MIEKILFGEVPIPGELIRIVVTFLGLVATTYYDLFNNKNIPEKVLFVFLAIALILNFYFYDADLSVFALILAFAIGLLGFLFHKLGQVGTADVLVLSAVSLLLPIHPSFSNMIFNFPFVLSLIVFSGVLFSLFVLFYYSSRLIKKKKRKPNFQGFLIIIPYFIFVYMYFQFPLFSISYFAIVSLIVLSSIFFLTYKEDINEMLVEKVKLKEAEEEDVVATEFMKQSLVKKYKIERVLTEQELKRLKKFRIKELWIYKNLPPFLPFLLAGFIMSLFFSNFLLV